jgi:hypothetical protein
VTVLAVTSITNILLASVVFFLAGRMSRAPKERFSAGWYFTGVLLLLGVAALIGAVDHGFFEPAGLPRYAIRCADWIVLGGVTFCLLMTTARQFFAPRVQRILLIIAVIQFIADTAVVLLVDNFLDVILNYVPVMLLFLAMNIIGLRNGTGSMQMIVGILILSAASAIQAAGWDALSPLDHNGVYHLVSILGVMFLYLGGESLKAK